MFSWTIPFPTLHFMQNLLWPQSNRILEGGLSLRREHPQYDQLNRATVIMLTPSVNHSFLSNYTNMCYCPTYKSCSYAINFPQTTLVFLVNYVVLLQGKVFPSSVLKLHLIIIFVSKLMLGHMNSVQTDNLSSLALYSSVVTPRRWELSLIHVRRRACPQLKDTLLKW